MRALQRHSEAEREGLAVELRTAVTLRDMRLAAVEDQLQVREPQPGSAQLEGGRESTPSTEST